MCSGRLLLESETICELLRNPSMQRFPLLLLPAHGKARTFLMATLTKLLFTQSRYPPLSTDPAVSRIGSKQKADDPLADLKLTPNEKFEHRLITFLKPLTDTADGLIQIATRNNSNNRCDPSTLRSEELRVALLGLCRDYRGVASSASSAREFELVLNWLCPDRMDLLVAGITAWADNISLSTPLLKLVAEAVHNRGSRIVFPVSSARGLVLFREAR